MLNPIKRVWVPKEPPSAAPVTAAQPNTVAADAAKLAADMTPHKRGMLFDELPEPEVTEKFSDSVWAEFDSVIPQETK